MERRDLTMKTGRRHRLRPKYRNDVAASIAWRNDPETRAMVVDYPFSLTEILVSAWYDSMQADHAGKCASFAIADPQSGTAFGFLLLLDIDWGCRSCELGTILGDPERLGLSIGAEAAGLAVEYAFQDRNLARICARASAVDDRAGAIPHNTLSGVREFAGCRISQWCHSRCRLNGATDR